MGELAVTHFVVLATVLFALGLFCVVTRRNALGILMGIELILNAANVNYVAFARYAQTGYDGQLFDRGDHARRGGGSHRPRHRPRHLPELRDHRRRGDGSAARVSAVDHPTPAAYVALIPLLPLAGAAVLGLFGARLQQRLGKAAIGWLACATVGAAFLLAVVAFVQLLGMPPEARGAGLLADLFPWIHVGTLRVDVAFAVDPLSAVMILVVTGIGGLIHLYATGYMHDDPGFWRFFAYLNLFTFAMLTLVLGDSLLLLFVGWEGVGF